MKKLVFSLVAVLLLTASCSMDGGAGDPFLPPDMGDAKDLEASGTLTNPEDEKELLDFSSKVYAEIVSGVVKEEHEKKNNDPQKLFHHWNDKATNIMLEIATEEDLHNGSRCSTIKMKGSLQKTQLPSYTVSGKIFEDMRLESGSGIPVEGAKLQLSVGGAQRGGMAFSVSDKFGYGGKMIICYAWKGSGDIIIDPNNLSESGKEILPKYSDIMNQFEYRIKLYNDENVLLCNASYDRDQFISAVLEKFLETAK